MMLCSMSYTVDHDALLDELTVDHDALLDELTVDHDALLDELTDSLSYSTVDVCLVS